MTSAFSWQNSISLCPASFHIPRPNLPALGQSPPPPQARLGPQSQASSATEPSGRGTPSASQSPGDRAHSLSPEASEGTPLSFLPFLLVSFSGSVPLSGFFSLITSGSETSVCSLSPWTQLCPLLSGSPDFFQHTLGHRRAPVHTHTHTHTILSAPSYES